LTPQRTDTLTKWVVSIVASGLIGLLSLLVVRDRVSIDVSLTRLQTLMESQSALLAKHEVELQLLKSNLKNLQDQSAQNGTKLDLILVESKKRAR
jgi:hypothetical protein